MYWQLHICCVEREYPRETTEEEDDAQTPMLSASAHKIQDVLKNFCNPIFRYSNVLQLYLYQLLHHANPALVLLLHWMVIDHVHKVHLQVINIDEWVKTF